MLQNTLVVSHCCTLSAVKHSSFYKNDFYDLNENLLLEMSDVLF